MLTGLKNSEAHDQNGMTETDMEACARVANRLNEVIIFRSTGPWAKRWIGEKFPTKNFHVKGKSSDWGPQAGFVPYDGIYSKVGHLPDKALKGTAANADGIAHSAFAVTSQLSLTAAQIHIQLTRKAENRCALESTDLLPNHDLILHAKRSGDAKKFAFYAKMHGDTYLISAVEGEFHNGDETKPLLVMGSAEVGAENRPMTGDYDLLAVCPPMRDRFSQVTGNASGLFKKDDLHLFAKGQASTAQGLEYHVGMGMDNVLDGRLHTGTDHRRSHVNARHPDNLHGPYQKGKEYDEHGDIGNVTPRILRCINALNLEMGAVGENGWARRVHHNAESHRFIDFGALLRKEMEGGDGFPFTAFLPSALNRGATAIYGSICTLESMSEFTDFAAAMQQMDYWMPTNFTWGMKSTRVSSIVDQFSAPGGPFSRHFNRRP